MAFEEIGRADDDAGIRTRWEILVELRSRMKIREMEGWRSRWCSDRVISLAF